MKIIGMAGHVDHGKTTLVKILTGIDCDRLKEEKARGMTTDLGFASFNLPETGEVSIIDVPGHEKYLRNMVSGVWGIDLAMLVVDAHEGWKEETEEHFKIIKLLDVSSIVIVLTKIDMVDNGEQSNRINEIRNHLTSSRYSNSSIISVSAITGEGIDLLKQTLDSALSGIVQNSENDKPYLYVDRVFTVKGEGLVVTGTQKNGIFAVDDKVLMLPQKKTARIRYIETNHRKGLNEASQRSAINLSGINSYDIGRGTLVVRKNFTLNSREILARFEPVDYYKIRNNINVEVAIGSALSAAKLIAVGSFDGVNTPLVRLRFEKEQPCFVGEFFLLLYSGGSGVIGSGKVIHPGFERFNSKSGYKKQNLVSLCKWDDPFMDYLELLREFRIEDLIEITAESEAVIMNHLNRLVADNSLFVVEDVFMTATVYLTVTECLKKISLSNDILMLKKIAGDLKLSEDILRKIITETAESFGLTLYENGEIKRSEINGIQDRESDVLLKKIIDAGNQGVELKSLSREDKSRLTHLVKDNKIKIAGGEFVLSLSEYEFYKKQVFNLFNPDVEKIAISDAKSLTGLSRKNTLALLTEMENEKFLERLGDYRYPGKNFGK